MTSRHKAELTTAALALPLLYLLSPLLVYASATVLGVSRGMDNAFADFLDVFYEPAQRLTEKWELYDRFIVWCLEVTGQKQSSQASSNSPLSRRRDWNRLRFTMLLCQIGPENNFGQPAIRTSFDNGFDCFPRSGFIRANYYPLVPLKIRHQPRDGSDLLDRELHTIDQHFPAWGGRDLQSSIPIAGRMGDQELAPTGLTSVADQVVTRYRRIRRIIDLKDVAIPNGVRKPLPELLDRQSQPWIPRATTYHARSRYFENRNIMNRTSDVRRFGRRDFNLDLSFRRLLRAADKGQRQSNREQRDFHLYPSIDELSATSTRHPPTELISTSSVTPTTSSTVVSPAATLSQP